MIISPKKPTVEKTISFNQSAVITAEPGKQAIESVTGVAPSRSYFKQLISINQHNDWAKHTDRQTDRQTRTQTHTRTHTDTHTQ